MPELITSPKKKRKRAYVSRMRNILGTALLAYWPMDETAGTTMLDASGAGRNIAYGATPLNNATSPNGKPAPLLNTILDAYPAINAVFNGDEGCIGGFVKHGNWTDAAAHYLLQFYTDGSNALNIAKTATNNWINLTRKGGGTVKTLGYEMNNADWHHIMFSWSVTNNEIVFWVNGSPTVRLSAIGTWVGALSAGNTKFGGWLTDKWNGYASDWFLANRPPTVAEAQKIATARVRPIRISIIGDSIAGNTSSQMRWPELLANLGYNGGWVGVMNHAIAGTSIMANFDAQSAACASDASDIIIMALGANDNDAGDMNALQAKVASNIDTLRASNPQAKLYYLNLLPRWTAIDGLTIKQMGNIRAAIAAACSAKSVTCWDSLTSPWIVVGDTSDGTHPTEAGSNIVAAQIMARI